MSHEAAYIARLHLDSTIDEHTYVPVFVRGVPTWVLAKDAVVGTTNFMSIFGDHFGPTLYRTFEAWKLKH